MEKLNRILITGAAGFIGFHLSKRLLEQGREVIGIDNFTDYYDPNLKEDRLAMLKPHRNFSFYKLDISDRDNIQRLFAQQKLDCVVNLAAQAGVRYSLINPQSYIDANIVGFANLLEGCRHTGVKHLVFASSSSVYGINTKMPFSVHHNVDHPISLYAATKKSNELMAHTYSYLFSLPCTGLRFFTVYGPWGRPDMALFLFTKAILEGKPISVFNDGKMRRDFTYIDDIVEGVVRIIDKIPEPDPEWNSESPDPSSSKTPYKIFNIGNNQPLELMYFIETIEKHLGKKAIKNLMPLQAGDVPATFADIDDLSKAVGFKPGTSLDYGIEKFIEWYRDYYKINKV